jgi:hypothetical protein
MDVAIEERTGKHADDDKACKDREQGPERQLRPLRGMCAIKN